MPPKGYRYETPEAPEELQLKQKTCSRCGLEKSVKDFVFIGIGRRDGIRKYRRFCRDCERDYQREKYQKNREIYIASTAVWQKANPEKVVIATKRYRDKNRALIAERARNRRAVDPVGVAQYEADRHLKANYGLTRKEWNALLEAQNYCCAGCLKKLDPEKSFESGRGRADKICVDHDHICCSGPKSCGRCVRGLLCDDCNKGAGSCKDDPETMERLAAYIRRHRDGHFPEQHST